MDGIDTSKKLDRHRIPMEQPELPIRKRLLVAVNRDETLRIGINDSRVA